MIIVGLDIPMPISVVIIGLSISQTFICSGVPCMHGQTLKISIDQTKDHT